MAWLIAEWLKHGRPTTLGFASGLVAGLVAITPASGFVQPWAALVIGLSAGLICYGAVLIKTKLGYDDSLDAFGVHGVGGFLGAVLTGVFATSAFGGMSGLIDNKPGQVGTQLLAAFVAAGFAAVGTLIILFLVDKTVGFRMSRNAEIEGMDQNIHGEHGWMLEQMPVPSIEMPGSGIPVSDAIGTSTTVDAREREKSPVH
jgi:Amt family ammonium transporter